MDKLIIKRTFLSYKASSGAITSTYGRGSGRRAMQLAYTSVACGTLSWSYQKVTKAMLHGDPDEGNDVSEVNH